MMNASAASVLAPAELARSALRRLAELKLPPTPELYTQHYYATPGAAPAPLAAAVIEPVDEKMVGRIGDILAKASEVTNGLAETTFSHSADMSASLEALVVDVMPDNAVDLLRAVVASAQAMHQTLKASHAELINARQSLSAIERELKESRQLLTTDPLTGTENRRAMSTILAREMAKSLRDEMPLSVAMVDIDHFKKINDTHGHDAGDAALVHLTQVARSMLRGGDTFIRYGGEEFLLVLCQTGLQAAVPVAERLQKELAKQPFNHRGTAIPMTFSAGVSTLQDSDDEAALLKRADLALYEAKRTGRNKVVAQNAAF